MERLTRKVDLDKGKPSFVEIEQTSEYITKNKHLAVNKLGQLEGIEEELGCPLDFVAKPFISSGLKKIWYHKQWCDVVRIVAYEEATKPYMEIRCKDYKYLKMVFLEDYKKTWWLKEDRSE